MLTHNIDVFSEVFGFLKLLALNYLILIVCAILELPLVSTPETGVKYFFFVFSFLKYFLFLTGFVPM